MLLLSPSSPLCHIFIIPDSSDPTGNVSFHTMPRKGLFGRSWSINTMLTTNAHIPVQMHQAKKAHQQQYCLSL